MSKIINDSAEKWFRNLPDGPSEIPRVIPVVGVTIECRILLRHEHDWEYVQETLDKCREFGAAEICGYKEFQK